MASDLELAWAAGLLDGEGCISLTLRQPRGKSVNPSYILILKVTMCDKATVERMYSIFKVGTLQNQSKQKAHYSVSYTWFCNAEAASLVIPQVRPWLFTKAKEADLAMEFLSLELANRGGNGGGQPMPKILIRKRHAYWLKLRYAKTRNISGERKLKAERKLLCLVGEDR